MRCHENFFKYSPLPNTPFDFLRLTILLNFFSLYIASQSSSVRKESLKEIENTLNEEDEQKSKGKRKVSSSSTNAATKLQKVAIKKLVAKSKGGKSGNASGKVILSFYG